MRDRNLYETTANYYNLFESITIDCKLLETIVLSLHYITLQYRTVHLSMRVPIRTDYP
ncbi:hypothetical protein LCGC14_1892950 [marine sediment metagenome]|uniref:Uncharacterized protein n=1 Tax=marine sediment metagenome TaxID=412755 RepID=A0A0F9IWZ1_9ZZZZ